MIHGMTPKYTLLEYSNSEPTEVNWVPREEAFTRECNSDDGTSDLQPSSCHHRKSPRGPIRFLGTSLSTQVTVKAETFMLLRMNVKNDNSDLYVNNPSTTTKWMWSCY
jgi:hypothetical protein